MAVMIRTDAQLVRAHGGDVIAPLAEGGFAVRWELREPGRRVYAESSEDLLAYLIPGYPDRHRDLPSAERLARRIRHAAVLKAQLTASMLSDSLTPLCESDQAVVLADAWNPPELQDDWRADVALVLLDVAYHPYSQRARPRGHILWLATFTAASYLRSLAAANLCTLAESQ